MPPRSTPAFPRASPVFVKYTSSPSPTPKRLAENSLSRTSIISFARQPIASHSPLIPTLPHQIVIKLMKTSLSLSDPIHVATPSLP
ncbi:hypothetical protein L210DRAFT_3568160 [Boletus edulis BED1]|uniref:Uncharacterized protein n=1 Tax=Boletus edulis BED1 TaxID=1328754 RepID=A0AAD4BE91_BOLED|nr:hypothetical protein L210DRAFT_3568160 [Boletus edulis BED1]